MLLNDNLQKMTWENTKCSLFGIVGVTDSCLDSLSRTCSNTITTLDVNGCIGIKVMMQLIFSNKVYLIKVGPVYLIVYLFRCRDGVVMICLNCFQSCGASKCTANVCHSEPALLLETATYTFLVLFFNNIHFEFLAFCGMSEFCMHSYYLWRTSGITICNFCSSHCSQHL